MFVVMLFVCLGVLFFTFMPMAAEDRRRNKH